MGSELLKICGVGVLCALVGTLIGQSAGGVRTALRLAGLAFGLGTAVALLAQVIAETEALGIGEGTAKYAEVLLRALGIAVLCRICSDVCKDCGELSMAGAVEGAGKLAVLLMALPLVAEILEYSKALLERL